MAIALKVLCRFFLGKLVPTASRCRLEHLELECHDLVHRGQLQQSLVFRFHVLRESAVVGRLMLVQDLLCKMLQQPLAIMVDIVASELLCDVRKCRVDLSSAQISQAS